MVKKMSGFSNFRTQLQARSTQAESVPKETGKVIPTQNSEGADCQVYGVAMSGINWKKLLWAIRCKRDFLRQTEAPSSQNFLTVHWPKFRAALFRNRLLKRRKRI